MFIFPATGATKLIYQWPCFRDRHSQAYSSTGILVVSNCVVSNLKVGGKLHQAELTEDPGCSVLLESLSFFLDVLCGYCHTIKCDRCQLDYLFFSSPHHFLTSLTHRPHDSATVWVICRKNKGVCTRICLVPIVHQAFIPHNLYALFLMASLLLIPPPFVSAFMHVIWRCTFKCQYLF